MDDLIKQLKKRLRVQAIWAVVTASVGTGLLLGLDGPPGWIEAPLISGMFSMAGAWLTLGYMTQDMLNRARKVQEGIKEFQRELEQYKNDD